MGNDYQKEANISCLLDDKEYEERKNGLLAVLTFFSKEEIRFGMACSFNLFLRGIVDEFHDFDLIVDINDIPKIKLIMEQLGANLVATGGNGFCESDIYLHYQLERVDFDIIAGFRVVTFDTQFIYCYDKDEIEDLTIYDKETIKIPLIPLEALYLLYAMMEGWQARRRFKRMLIQQILEENKKSIRFRNILESALEYQELPGAIQRNVRNILAD